VPELKNMSAHVVEFGFGDFVLISDELQIANGGIMAPAIHYSC